MSKPLVLVQFEGVICKTGRDGALGRPVRDVVGGLVRIRAEAQVLAFSRRCATPRGRAQIGDWLYQWGIELDGMTAEYMAGAIVVAQRAVNFAGWEDTSEEVSYLLASLPPAMRSPVSRPVWPTILDLRP